MIKLKIDGADKVADVLRIVRSGMLVEAEPTVAKSWNTNGRSPHLCRYLAVSVSSDSKQLYIAVERHQRSLKQDLEGEKLLIARLLHIDCFRFTLF